MSCFLDINSKHILTVKIVETTVNEIDLAIEHLENLKERFDIEKMITIYNRGYPSIELMVKTINLNSKFLNKIAPKKNVFLVVGGSPKLFFYFFYKIVTLSSNCFLTDADSQKSIKSCFLFLICCFILYNLFILYATASNVINFSVSFIPITIEFFY